MACLYKISGEECEIKQNNLDNKKMNNILTYYLQTS